MAFIDDIVDVMTGDASINSLFTGGIRYEHLPTDFDNTKDWLVFSYTLEEEERTLDGNSVYRYNLQTQISSPSLENVQSIWNIYNPYLSSIDDGSKIRDIYIVDDDTNFDTEKRMYYLTANYNVLFID
jgi:hypothetical protein